MSAPIPRPHAVLFDLFHTLIRLEPGGELGPPTWVTLGVDREQWQRHFYADVAQRMIGTIADPIEAIQSVLDAMGADVPAERVAETARLRVARIADAMHHVAPETLAALESLREAGIRLALVSNAGLEEITPWDESPLAPLFDSVVFSCNVRIAKPGAGIYEHALRAVEVEAGEALFVGDGGSDELRGARRVGLSPVFLERHCAELWPETVATRRSLADHTVYDAADLARRVLAT